MTAPAGTPVLCDAVLTFTRRRHVLWLLTLTATATVRCRRPLNHGGPHGGHLPHDDGEADIRWV